MESNSLSCSIVLEDMTVVEVEAGVVPEVDVVVAIPETLDGSDADPAA